MIRPNDDSVRAAMDERAAAHGTTYVGRGPHGWLSIRLWRCPADHQWRTDYTEHGPAEGMCPECVHRCVSCGADRAGRDFQDAGRLLKTCAGCRDRVNAKRRATTELCVQTERLAEAQRQALRPVARMDEMDDDVLLRILLCATEAAPPKAACLLITARLVCRKMERCSFEHARADLQVDATRSQVVWYMSGMGPRRWTPVGIERQLAVPAAMFAFDATDLRLVDGIREAMWLYGTPKTARAWTGASLEQRLFRHLVRRARDAPSIAPLVSPEPAGTARSRYRADAL